MTQRPKRNHAKVWAMVQAHFEPWLRDAGFSPHPAHPPGYDPSNRMWECSFIAAPAPDGIRVVELRYAPHDSCWSVTGYLHACADAAERIAGLTGSAREHWYEDVLKLRWRRSDLNVSFGWAFWRRAFWRRAFWRAPREVSFNKKTGEPVDIEHGFHRATLALPAFFADLARQVIRYATAISCRPSGRTPSTRTLSATLHVGVSHPRAHVPAVLDLIQHHGFDPSKLNPLISSWDDAPRTLCERTTKVIIQRPRLHPAGA